MRRQSFFKKVTNSYDKEEIFLEIKHGMETPAPDNYCIEKGEDIVRHTRYSKIGFGYDIKSNMKLIKQSPGPGHYETESLTRMSSKLLSKGFNYYL